MADTKNFASMLQERYEIGLEHDRQMYSANLKYVDDWLEFNRPKSIKAFTYKDTPKGRIYVPVGSGIEIEEKNMAHNWYSWFKLWGKKKEVVPVAKPHSHTPRPGSYEKLEEVIYWGAPTVYFRAVCHECRVVFEGTTRLSEETIELLDKLGRLKKAPKPKKEK